MCQLSASPPISLGKAVVSGYLHAGQEIIEQRILKTQIFGGCTSVLSDCSVSSPASSRVHLTLYISEDVLSSVKRA